MVTVSQIREHLLDLLTSEAKEEALVSFEDWLVKASWNMHLNSDVRAQQFAADIQLQLAEMDAENFDFDALWKKLKAVLSAHSLLLSEKPELVVSSSSTEFTPQRWAFSLVDRQFVEACG